MPSVYLLRRTPQALRQARSALFDEAPGWQCVGVSAQMHEARDEIERLRPDVIVSDLHLLDGQAITLLKRLQHASPRALLLTTLIDEPLLFDTLCGGAHGYWLDQSGAKGLGTALIDFHQRRAHMSPALARQTLQAFGLQRSELKLAQCVSSAHDLSPALPGCALSRSEQHLLSLVAQGLLKAEIAQRWQMETAEIGQRLGYIYAALHRLHGQVAARFRASAAPYR
jgi:DNA-binding NarL/FixJ family response regulator